MAKFVAYDYRILVSFRTDNFPLINRYSCSNIICDGGNIAFLRYATVF